MEAKEIQMQITEKDIREIARNALTCEITNLMKRVVKNENIERAIIEAFEDRDMYSDIQQAFDNWIEWGLRDAVNKYVNADEFMSVITKATEDVINSPELLNELKQKIKNQLLNNS